MHLPKINVNLQFINSFLLLNHDSKQQTANSKQQTANSKQQKLTAALFATFLLLVCTTSLQAQIKVWPNNHTSVGYSTSQPNEQLNVTGDFYLIPNGTSASGGFYFENYHNQGNGGAWFDEPILRPMFSKSMWLGNPNYEIYRVFATEMYLTNNVVVTSDRTLKTNIRVWNESALDKIMHLKVYRYDMDPSKYTNVPEEKVAEVTQSSANKIGFMAQELQVEFPEVVKQIPGTENLGVDYNMMVPVLLEAIKEQQNLIIELQEKVEALENK